MACNLVVKVVCIGVQVQGFEPCRRKLA